jgi:anti-sigma B factor antagonist
MRDESQMRARIVTDRSVTTVLVAGELDLSVASALQETVEWALSCGAPALVLDLSELSFCDSSGLSVLAITGQLCRASGVDYAITGATGAVRKVLDLTGVDKVEPVAKAS